MFVGSVYRPQTLNLKPYTRLPPEEDLGFRLKMHGSKQLSHEHVNCSLSSLQSYSGDHDRSYYVGFTVQDLESKLLTVGYHRAWEGY